MRVLLLPFVFASLSIGSITAYAQTPTMVPFESHAQFFSDELAQPHGLDPQVFVIAADAPAAHGLQGIDHVAGIRNAWIDDPAAQPIYDARGRPLSMTLGKWLGAQGMVTLTPRQDGREDVFVSLTGLKPGARFSLFENHFDQRPIGFTPLDGAARTNSFRADALGDATVRVVAPALLTHESAVLVVYHSDGRAHGEERGEIGVNAHHQLIARPR
jgi:hypothetical protein